MDWKTEWAKRPWWMNLVLLFSIYMTFIYSPFDVVMKPVADDEDVWFGYMFFGWQAKVGGIIHWLVYAALAFGLWKMTSWCWLLGSLYATQVAIAMFLWPMLQQGSQSWPGALIAGVIFAVPAVAFWRSRQIFSNATPQTP